MKINKIKSDNLVVESADIREALVGDLTAAEAQSGKADGYAFMSALLSQVATFDGKKLPPEDIRRLSMTDFLALAKELAGPELEGWLKEQSTSLKKEGSDIKK